MTAMPEPSESPTLPDRYDPRQTEERWYRVWEERGYFRADPFAKAPPYCIVIPPPNVTGSLHIGHALNNTLQDILIRWKRMDGFNALWQPGTDHAGIATQVVVERQLAAAGTSREALGREAFVRRVWEWREASGGTILRQLKRLGASCDWERERFTMDAGLSAAVREVFVRLWEEGLVYQGQYIVNWCPRCRTVLSDLEVEHEERDAELYYLKYGPLSLATVRPETKLGDTAVAVHPRDRRYAKYVGQTLTIPSVEGTIELRVVADSAVDPKFGTGVVKVTPAHDPADFEIGRRHGLEVRSVIDEDGRMNARAGRYAGLDRFDARRRIVEDMRALGLIEKVEPYRHRVGVCYRCRTVVEPLVSKQWYVRTRPLAEPAIKAVREGRTRIVPRAWTKTYYAWMENIRDWCISRQLWWGHRLPVWYCDACGETYVAETAPERCGACGGELRQEDDVLDTWFSSALWPFAVLGWPDSTPELAAFYPTSFLTTAREIIFLWVARMVMMGIEFAGDIPFGDVYVHPVIQAADGRRMSKSLGTGIDPLDEIDAHGADGVRFGLLAMSSTQDVRYNAARIQQGQDLANKMWNASRLVLLNAAPIATDVADRAPTRVEDRWIVSRLQRAIASATRSIDSYDFAHAALDLYDYFWSELCDWYLEIVKPRLYDGDPDASATLLWILEQTLALIHPVMPFVTEEIYSYLRVELTEDAAEMLVVHPYPEVSPELVDEEAEAAVQAWIDLTRRVRRWRDLVGVAAASVLPARVSGGDASPPHELVGRLARLSFDGTNGEALATFGSVEILSSDDVDAEQVRRRIAERRETLQAEVARAEGKLANSRFVDKAPADVVEAERTKLARYQAELEDLS